MCWEQKVATIVMMTRLEERARIKCDQYWPTRGSDTYGVVSVMITDVQELATYCVRTFQLHRLGTSIYRNHHSQTTTTRIMEQEIDAGIAAEIAAEIDD